MQFKDRLKILRKERKMTQVQLGKMLNYGYTAIANYESGRNSPSIEDLKKIASIFNVSMDFLLGVNDIRYPYVREDKSNEFNEVRRHYAAISQSKRKIAELLFYMEWLEARPGEDAMQEAVDNIPAYTKPWQSKAKLASPSEMAAENDLYIDLDTTQEEE